MYSEADNTFRPFLKSFFSGRKSVRDDKLVERHHEAERRLNGERIATLSSHRNIGTR